MDHPIAIDYTPAIDQSAGIGRLVRELIAHVAELDHKQEFRLFVAGSSVKLLPNVPGSNFTWKSTPITTAWLARIWHRLHIPLPVEAFTGSVNLYHATDFVLPPTLKKTKTIVTVHDLSFVHVPQASSPRLKAYLDRVVPNSVKHADHVLADSIATKDDIIALYSVDPDKVTVLYSGVNSSFRQVEIDPDFLFQKYNIPKKPYIFSIGTVQPRKNYIRLIQALAQLRENKTDIDLVIAGGKGWLDNPIYDEVARLKLEEYVHFIGFADDTDLPMLYSAAHCIAYISLYEGFGFPVLEGMACGTPVITSDVSSLPEVAGDAALMVNPYDVNAIVSALQSVIHDDNIRQTMILKGYEQVKNFTWRKSAQDLLNIYDRILHE